MIKRTGYADLPLHSGTVPRWLADRMMQLGTEIVRALLMEYGKREVLVRYVEGKSYVEIAAEMNRHVKSIDNALQRIKRKLMKYLEEK